MKFKDLKIDYKQMLDSFEKSENIRREQKEMIHDQKHQIRHLKNAVKKSEKRIKKLKVERWNTDTSDFERSMTSRTSTQKSLKSSRSRTPKRPKLESRKSSARKSRRSSSKKQLKKKQQSPVIINLKTRETFRKLNSKSKENLPTCRLVKPKIKPILKFR